jgi:hypothetical protein
MIEKGIPLPDDQGTDAPRTRKRYEWAAMEIGDSVYVDGVGEGKLALQAAYTYASKARSTRWFVHPTNPDQSHWEVIGKKKFAGRREGSGWRIWRIADAPFEPHEWFESEISPGVRWLKE